MLLVVDSELKLVPKKSTALLRSDGWRALSYRSLSRLSTLRLP
jgi:hypothetical protein